MEKIIDEDSQNFQIVNKVLVDSNLFSKFGNLKEKIKNDTETYSQFITSSLEGIILEFDEYNVQNSIDQAFSFKQAEVTSNTLK